MRKRFIMTAFGKDRPGFIADISQLIYENRCNLEDSTMTNLSDEFAMIFLFEGVEDDSTGEPLEKSLLRECRRLEKDKGISAFVREISPEIPKPKEHIINKTLHVEGLDQAGIVYKISRYLAEHDVNISSFDSRMSHSPQTGASMYTIDIQIEVPGSLSGAQLDEGLNTIGNELNVDITAIED